MGCSPHGYHRVCLTEDNPRMLQRKPSKVKDPAWMQMFRERWNKGLLEEKRCQER